MTGMADTGNDQNLVATNHSLGVCFMFRIYVLIWGCKISEKMPKSLNFGP